MSDRRDALCAAAELVLAIETAARTSGAADTVATVGICEVFPGAVNSIPSRVHLTVDLRDTSLARRGAAVGRNKGSPPPPPPTEEANPAPPPPTPPLIPPPLVQKKKKKLSTGA